MATIDEQLISQMKFFGLFSFGFNLENLKHFQERHKQRTNLVQQRPIECQIKTRRIEGAN